MELSLQTPLASEKCSSICPKCGNTVIIEKQLEKNILYITRKCPNDLNKRELVCKTDKITENYFWNSPASDLIKEKDYSKNIRVFDVLITKKCSSDCNVCFAKWCGDKYEEMSIENLKALLKNVKNSRIVLNGGEPTEREDLPELIRTIAESSNKPLVYTNGLKISNISYLRKLKNVGLRELSMSFDGFNKEIYESIRGGRYQYSLVLRALKNLEKENMKTLLYSTIVRGVNEDQVSRILDYAISHSFIWTTSFKPLYLPGTNPSSNFNKNNILSYSDILNLINEKFEEIDYNYILLTQKIFLSLQKMLASKKFPIYLSWVDLPSIYISRNGDKSRPVFSYKTLEKMSDILESDSMKFSLKSLLKKLPFNLDILENSARRGKIFRILLGGIMPQISSYHPPIGMLCQKNNKLALYSYLAW